MKIGEMVFVDRPYLAQTNRFKEFYDRYFPKTGVVEYISERFVVVMMLSNITGKRLYRESFPKNEVYPINDLMCEKS